MSPKQSTIVAALRDCKEITTQEAVALIGRDIYANAAKHVGNVLSNMVCKGMIERAGRGKFRLPADSQALASAMSQKAKVGSCISEGFMRKCPWNGWRQGKCVVCPGVTG